VVWDEEEREGGDKKLIKRVETRHLRNKSYFRALARAHRSGGGEGGGDVGEFSFSPFLGLCFSFCFFWPWRLFWTVGWVLMVLGFRRMEPRGRVRRRWGGRGWRWRGGGGVGRVEWGGGEEGVGSGEEGVGG